VKQGVSAITLNATITGLKFFFEATLGQAELMSKMHPVRVRRTLPIILSREEVSRLIEAARTLKHRTALSVAYGAGLRVSEVTALKGNPIARSNHVRRFKVPQRDCIPRVSPSACRSMSSVEKPCRVSNSALDSMEDLSAPKSGTRRTTGEPFPISTHQPAMPWPDPGWIQTPLRSRRAMQRYDFAVL